jgi:hypothetical protein
LIKIDVVKFSERWLKEILVFLKKLRGLIKMSRQCLDYYLFSIKFGRVLYNWQHSGILSKLRGVCKAIERRLE